MKFPIRTTSPEPNMTPYHPLRRSFMTWVTPQAIELRFGMEITMYILNR
jgi:coenzyme PQQ precursor peptide PqqA